MTSPRPKLLRKSSRVLMEQLAGHLSNSPLGIVEYDQSLTVTQWSSRCEEIFEWSSEEILSNDITAFNLIYEEDLEKTSKVAVDLMSGKSKWKRLHQPKLHQIRQDHRLCLV